MELAVSNLAALNGDFPQPLCERRGIPNSLNRDKQRFESGNFQFDLERIALRL